MVSFISYCPEEIFRIIQTYLSYDDYHYFMNTSKQLFASLKRKTVYFSLDRKRSFQYLTEVNFQRLLLSKVVNGWDQIKIHYKEVSLGIPSDLPVHAIVGSVCPLPVKEWNNFQSIVCHCPKGRIEIPPIPNVKNLHLFFYTQDKLSRESINLTALSHLSTFCLNHLRVKDISPLKDIPELSLFSCEVVTDFSMFCNQRILKINRCRGLSDVTSFKSIRTLELSNCVNVTDVRPLKSIHDLSLFGCPGITDISCLGNHHRLLICQLADNLTGYDCFLHIPHASLVRCNIKDVSMLRYAKSVYLSKCSEIDDVSSLRNVKKVQISMGRMLFGLNELQAVPDLSLTFENSKGNEVPRECIVLSQNKRLQLSSALIGIESLSMFSPKIEHLTIKRSETICRLISEGQGSSLQYLTSLTLEYMSLQHLEGLGNIPTVKLFYCSQLRDLRGLGRNRCVKVSYCSDLEDVSSLATVPIVTIKCCKKLTEKSYECLQYVPRLKIDDFIPLYI